MEISPKLWTQTVQRVVRAVNYSEYMSFSARLKQARLEAKLNQPALAKMAGLTKSAINQLEGGGAREPKAENLFALADALRVDARWLATGKALRYADLDPPPGISKVGEQEPWRVDLDMLERCIATMFEAALSRKHRPTSGKFARDCLLLYEMSKEGDATTILKSASRLLSDEP
jgi:transcriptional regulator with XRE-family HTH domain